MNFLFRHFSASPSLIPLAGVVGATVGGGIWYLGHKFRKDPEITTQSRTDPFPYLRVQPNDRLKLYAVNQKFEDNELDRIDLLDILSDRYDV